MRPSAIDFVLVRSKRPENVAAACRALKNMGFGRVVLVEPPSGLAAPSARALAYGAWEVLDGAWVAPGLREAVAASAVVVATSGRQDEDAVAPRDLAPRLDALAAGGRVSVVFGPEDHGLTREELRLCHVRARVPTDAAQPSLNLAQAVLVLAYELRLAGEAERARPSVAQAAPITAAALEDLVDDLRATLSLVGYLNPQSPEAILGELRALLWRARPTAREVSLLHGALRQVRWAAGRGAAERGRAAARR